RWPRAASTGARRAVDAVRVTGVTLHAVRHMLIPGGGAHTRAIHVARHCRRPMIRSQQAPPPLGAGASTPRPRAGWGRGRSRSITSIRSVVMLKKLVLASALVAGSALAQQNVDISGANFQSGSADATLADLGRKSAASG